MIIALRDGEDTKLTWLLNALTVQY